MRPAGDVGIEMIAHRAGDVVKTGLPQDGVVEQTLDENHLRTMPDLLPRIQAALGARQKRIVFRREFSARTELLRVRLMLMKFRLRPSTAPWLGAFPPVCGIAPCPWPWRHSLDSGSVESK